LVINLIATIRDPAETAFETKMGATRKEDKEAELRESQTETVCETRIDRYRYRSIFNPDMRIDIA